MTHSLLNIKSAAESALTQAIESESLTNCEVGITLAEKAIEGFNRIGDKHNVALAYKIMARLAVKLQRYHEAIYYLEQSVEIMDALVRKNDSVIESLDYAKHVQDSILPHPTTLNNYFPDSFVWQRPKDIISGDFLWIYEKENEILVAAVDCTGHGVSGALMSVVANSLLNQIASGLWIPNPSFVLNELNHVMERTLVAEDGLGLKDSLDIALCSINRNKSELMFAGVHNSVYIVSNGHINEYKGENIFIGNTASVKFNNHRVKLQKGDCLYLFSDGFADQKGGPDRRKFYYNPFKQLLLKNSHLSMIAQKRELDKVMYEWMGKEKQMDDMLVVGIRI